MKLISMTEFALQRFDILHNSYKEWKSEDHHHAELDYIRKIDSYARFIRQPLTFGMFVPVDEGGTIIGEPKDYWWQKDSKYGSFPLTEQYKKAKEKVLFEGVKIINKDNFFLIEDTNGYWLRVVKKNTSTTVEDLLKLTIVQLTPFALKQIGL